MQKTDKFSRIVSGTMTWGSWGKELSKNEMIDLMHHCIEFGLTTFDHADIYGSYSTEADFGKAYAESGIQRENIQLVSKSPGGGKTRSNITNTIRIISFGLLRNR